MKKDSFLQNKAFLDNNFKVAAEFIENLKSSERIRKGFNVGIIKNLNFYLNNWFLFRMEFIGYDAIKFDYRRRKVPNKEIKSIEFLEVVRKVVKNSSSKGRYDFYQDVIIIRNINVVYLELVNEAIDEFYIQVIDFKKVDSKNNMVILTHTEHITSKKNVIKKNNPSISNGNNEQEPNIRSSSGINESYFKINREERNLCAILFHSLLQNDNLKVFLDVIKCDFPIVDSEFGIYLEYAFIRDIWESIRKKHGIVEGNKIKKKLIIEILNLSNHKELEDMSNLEFNSFFVQSKTRRPSSGEIESPGNWSVMVLDKNIPDNDDFMNACRFKWSFNAKPDLVIHTSNNHAVCVRKV